MAFTVIDGVSNNAKQFAEAILADAPPTNPHDPALSRHGGPFAVVELGINGLASMTIIDDTKTI